MKLKFSGHAMDRMFARSIRPEDVRTVIDHGEPIADYPDDRPFPSRLVLAFVDGRAIHVVFGYDSATETAHVVTAYIPDSALWESDFKTRKRKPR
ncbi:DUF4258 domain-containing protein [Polyangium jinanense]|uniref:DUF4258 domain-containing protein n=1 Tax=Polyangium jinanense TaxID=2829994 RepID=A0A9X3XAU5_9BACT|nr:DUF4258 domain-containing protein [Polyangium jinanense]MDC3956614.1 DUF4258 domain-containing protein [Polyangium jinanense]MDC3985603.1 DUF4258 domain-containing protein [Polyangium jinanense]